MRDVLSWSFPIGQLFGIMIRLHVVMPIVLIGLIGREWLREGAKEASSRAGAGAWMDAAMLMALIFVSVLLHELGHCFAARRMDGEADEVLLWPLGGLAFCRSLPHTPLAHFVTALGGPLVNFILCLLSGLLLSFAFEHHYQPQFNPIWYPYRAGDNSIAMPLPTWNGAAEISSNFLAINLARLFWVNWLQLLVNVLLIGIPFDGGRMLQATLWPRLGHYQSSKVAIYSGFVIMLMVGLLSIVFTEPLLAFLTIFIFVSCAQEMMTLESAHEDSLFGYDFSQGYTSLEKDEPAPPRLKRQNFVQRWLAKRAARRLQQEQEQRLADDRRMDELLEKIQKFGKDSLTDEEHRFLKRVADRYKNKP
jgi:stage IV sporulation protein FB